MEVVARFEGSIDFLRRAIAGIGFNMPDNEGEEAVGGEKDSSPIPLEWKFSQVFGERSAGEEVQEGAFIVFYFLFLSFLLLTF